MQTYVDGSLSTDDFRRERIKLFNILWEEEKRERGEDGERGEEGRGGKQRRERRGESKDERREGKILIAFGNCSWQSCRESNVERSIHFKYKKSTIMKTAGNFRF